MYARLVNMIMTRFSSSISFCASVSEPNCVYEQTCMSVFMCVVRPSALKVAVVWVMGVLSWLDRQLVQTSGLLCLCSLRTGRVKKSQHGRPKIIRP